MGIIETAIMLAIAAVIFVVFFKVFRWAIEAVIVFILVLAGLYVALRVLNYNEAGDKIIDLLNQIKSMLGF